MQHRPQRYAAVVPTLPFGVPHGKTVRIRRFVSSAA